MNSSLNNFAIIIGAMKCGTTSLFYYLSEHPQIIASREKELHFFSDDQRLAKGVSWYYSQWEWHSSYKIAIEASPSYTMQPILPNVAERIAHIAQTKDARFRFIYIMRHPFARIESHIRHQLCGKQNSLEHSKKVQIEQKYIAYTEYAKQLDAYVQIFGRDQLHLLLLEDLQREPQVTLSEMCKFLGVNPQYQFKSVDVIRNNRETLNLHPVIEQLRQKSMVKPLVNLMSPRLRQKLRKSLQRQDSYKFSLSEEDKALITKQLQPDLTRLELEYGVDVQNKWDLPIAQ